MCDIQSAASPWSLASHCDYRDFLVKADAQNHPFDKDAPVSLTHGRSCVGTGTDFRILRGDGYQGKILRGDGERSWNLAWGQILKQQFCLETDSNTKFSESEFENTPSAIRFTEFLIF